MSTIKEQFMARHALEPKPKWVCGDRISGKLGKILVVGMVIREDYYDRSLVLCHLDLPVKGDGGWNWIMQVPSKSMKRLKVTE